MVQPLHSLFFRSRSEDMLKASTSSTLASGLKKSKALSGLLLLFTSGCLLWYRNLFSWCSMTFDGNKSGELFDAAPLIGMLSLNAVRLSSKKKKKKNNLLQQISNIVDGHNDFPIWIRAFYGNHIYQQNFTQEPELYGQVDFPRLRQGHLRGQFWSVYVEWYVISISQN